jgi:hypothetical protein
MEAPKGGHLVRTGTRPAFGCSTGKFFGCPKNFDFSQALPNDVSGCHVTAPDLHGWQSPTTNYRRTNGQRHAR